MSNETPLYIPVILGTTRQGRRSEFAARVVLKRVETWPRVNTELIDIATLPQRVDNEGQALRDPAFAEKMTRADALVIVSPEYNHGYSGTLKRVLDTCLKEYIHKAVGVVGVSAGPWGGTRGIQDLLPVLRELGLVTIFWDVYFTNSYKAFDDQGNVTDLMQLERIDKFLAELVWMAKTLKHGREHIALEGR